MTRAERALALAASIGFVLAVWWPVHRAPRDDGFPLSTYPMFATPRATTMSLDYAVAIDAAGGRRPVPPHDVANGEVLAASAVLRAAVGRGRAGIAELCARIAARVARDPALAGTQTIAIVTGKHDAVDLLVRGVRGPERERGRCPVPGQGAP
ncbi:MAG: hypothetical protein R2939_21520 [Kofleriaceae bacterium]